MSAAFSVTRYCRPAATAVWTLGWVLAAAAAGLRLSAVPDAGGAAALLVAGAFATIGCWWTARGLRRGSAAVPDDAPLPPQSWPRRVLGWFAAVVWCSVAVAWNFGVIAWLIRGAYDGRWWLLLVMIPWSLIGLFLLIVFSAGLCTIIDSAGAGFRRSVT